MKRKLLLVPLALACIPSAQAIIPTTDYAHILVSMAGQAAEAAAQAAELAQMVQQYQVQYQQLAALKDARGLNLLLMGAGAMASMGTMPETYDQARQVAGAASSLGTSYASLQQSIGSITNGTPMYYASVNNLAREQAYATQSYDQGKYRTQRIKVLIEQSAPDMKSEAELSRRMAGEQALLANEQMKQQSLEWAMRNEARMLEMKQMAELDQVGSRPIPVVVYH